MPKKITVDARGTVILVEDVPEREVPVPPPKRGERKKTGGKTTRTYARPAREEGTKPPVELIACSMCNATIPKGQMARHLRKAHLYETVERRREDIKDINRDLQKMVPGFHRLQIEELQRKRALLQKDLEDLQRTAQERHGTNT